MKKRNPRKFRLNHELWQELRQKEYLTLPEVAKVFSTLYSTIHNYVLDGTLIPYIQMRHASNIFSSKYIEKVIKEDVFNINHTRTARIKELHDSAYSNEDMLQTLIKEGYIVTAEDIVTELEMLKSQHESITEFEKGLDDTI